MKSPTIKEIRSLLISLKPTIEDEYRAYEDCGDEDTTPSMLVTVGANDAGEWSYQTGDTSYTGGVYHYPHWGQAALMRRSNCTELARQIVDEIKDSQASKL